MFFYCIQDEGEVEEIPEETKNFLLEWLKGRAEEVSTQLTLTPNGHFLVAGSERHK